MLDLIKELSALAASWISGSYQRIYKDLTEKPLITLATIFILCSIATGLSFGGLLIKNEIYKKDSTIIFDKLNNDEN